MIKSKINHESGKGVIIYDEDATEESIIRGEIENAGDYQIEEVKEGVITARIAANLVFKNSFRINQLTPREVREKRKIIPRPEVELNPFLG